MRLQLRKAQAEADDSILVDGDESEALTHPCLARASWRSQAPLGRPSAAPTCECRRRAQAKKVALVGALDLFGDLTPFQRVPGPPPPEVFFRSALESWEGPIVTRSWRWISAIRSGSSSSAGRRPGLRATA